MTDHLDETLIHEFVDGELAGAERARVTAHLADCPACRAVAASARSLREEAERVFGAAETEVGDTDWNAQWSAIESRIRAAAQSTAVGPRRRWMTPMRAAAAAILIVASSAVTYVVTRQRPEQAAEVEAPTPGAVAVGLADIPPATAIADAYTPVLTELERLLAEARDRLAPETVATLEANLQIMNAAIRDIEQALADDPSNRATLKSLDGMYQAKLDVLRRAITLAPEA